MAIYHLSTKPISRSSGRTATASIAYRAGIAITDERTGKSHDYTKRSGVVSTRLHTPNDLKIERNELWNLAETTETRKNSRTAREIVVNLPHELSNRGRIVLVNDFAKDLANQYGVAVDVAVHTPDAQGDNRNHHAHIMLTTRKLERLESGRVALTSKSQLEMSNTQLKERGLPSAREELKAIREQWANITNRHLKEANIDAQIDHRSHKDRGLIFKPTKKLGWEASALERKGIRTETGDHNRQVKAFNKSVRELMSLNRQLKQVKIKEQANDRAKQRAERPSTKLDRQVSTERPTNERKRGLSPAGEQKGDKLGQGHNSEVRRTDSPAKQPAKQPADKQPQAVEALKTKLSISEKRNLLRSFNQHIDQEAEKLLKSELKQIREQAKPQLDKINQLRDSKPFNPFKVKAWQQDIDKRVEQYNKIKAHHDQLKANGVTKEYRTQAMRDYYLERPEAYDTIVDIQKQLKEHDQQQEAQQQERVRTSSRDSSRGIER